MYDDMKTEEHDLICRIHRLEDKLLRSKNFNTQLELQQVLMNYRKRLQTLQWKIQKSLG